MHVLLPVWRLAGGRRLAIDEGESPDRRSPKGAQPPGRPVDARWSAVGAGDGASAPDETLLLRAAGEGLATAGLMTAAATLMSSTKNLQLEEKLLRSGAISNQQSAIGNQQSARGEAPEAR